MNTITIGLFGTCGNSTWRNDFISEYEKEGISFFNPQKDDWKEEDAEIEANHLVNDEIILFPVTGETYGTGSLAETGFSVMQAIRSDKHRAVIVYIDTNLDESLKENAVAFKESKRARALTLAHLKKIKYANVYIVDSLDKMLKVSLLLHKSYIQLSEIKGLCEG